jgi:hypothetical protein
MFLCITCFDIEIQEDTGSFSGLYTQFAAFAVYLKPVIYAIE